jgi:tetratricopeptide (TPR) repeat protein
MAVLDKEIQDKIDELRTLAYDFYQKEEYEKYYELANKQWNLYPDPKENWNEAYNTAKYIFKNSIIIKNHTEAKKWLDRMIENNNNLHLSEYEIDYNIGKYLFETGDYEGAYNSWDKIVRVKMVSFRYFKNDDQKYIKFYKEQRALKDKK